MEAMSAYNFSQDVHGETYLEGYGRVEFEYAAGVVEPGDAKEAALLELLLVNEVASVPSTKPKAKSSKSDQPVQEQE